MTVTAALKRVQSGLKLLECKTTQVYESLTIIANSHSYHYDVTLPIPIPDADL